MCPSVRASASRAADRRSRRAARRSVGGSGPRFCECGVGRLEGATGRGPIDRLRAGERLEPLLELVETADVLLLLRSTMLFGLLPPAGETLTGRREALLERGAFRGGERGEVERGPAASERLPPCRRRRRGGLGQRLALSEHRLDRAAQALVREPVAVAGRARVGGAREAALQPRVERTQATPLRTCGIEGAQGVGAVEGFDALA